MISAVPWTRHSPPTGRQSSTPLPTLTCRRCRRTLASSRPRRSRRHSGRAIPSRPALSARPCAMLEPRFWRRSEPIKRGAELVSGIEGVEVSAYTIPTDFPESDGTLEWDKTTIVIVESTTGGSTGIGYTYGDTAVAALIEGKLAGIVN